ncbi:MAG: hypothetical protein HKN25_05980 [Pyrinomonadaceae bacterium]|nr:hypothetical protein [Pyrinomonadaceae bacterium]
MKNLLILLASVFTFSLAILAGEPSIWSINSRDDVIKGDAKGVSISHNGTIALAPQLSELFNTEQPFVWSSTIDTAGNIYLGTGGDGKLFKVDANGKSSLFYDADELNVSALAIGKDGTVYAGTSPDGKVYRVSKNGNASVYFEPKEKYIWSLAVTSDGSLAVGTGETGKIYKVKSANAKPAEALLFDTSETHIISLAADAKGNLYAGTDSDGLVLRFNARGKPFALLDSSLREIHEIALGVDGSVYALALSESASSKDKKIEPKKDEKKTVSIGKKTGIPIPTPKKSRYDLTAAKSAVYRILPDGGNDIIWKSDEITAFSVYAHLTGNGVLIGTSDKGRIYSVRNTGEVTLTLQTDEEQVSTIFTSGTKLFATSSNQGKLFNFGGGSLTEGVFESPVLDAKSVASWGSIWWRSNGNVQIQTRSGNTDSPNETWADWSGSYKDSRGERITSPRAQFLQWRAILKSSDQRSSVSEVNVSFLPRNIPPEVLSIEVLPTNVGLTPNPPVPVDPNIATLGLDPADFGMVIPPPIPRKVFQSGAKSLSWKAEDRNGDQLKYSIYYREVSNPKFRLLESDLDRPFFTIDGLALADGRYIFKVVADDSPSNAEAQALKGERTSEPFDIDNTAPVVTPVGTPQINGDSVRIVFDSTEASSLIKRAEYAVNGGAWKTIFADDGISDGPKERYTIRVTIKEPGEYSVTLRVFDTSGNAGTGRMLVKK